jgi:hypothetical protein
MTAAKNIRRKRDRLLQLHRRLEQLSPATTTTRPG